MSGSQYGDRIEQSLRDWLGEPRPPLTDRDAQIDDILHRLPETPQAKRRFLGRWFDRDGGARRRSAERDHPPDRNRGERLMFSTTGLVAIFAVLALGLSALEPAPPPSAGMGGPTLVVAADGSGDFATITEAVAAAADGDTVLVRPGTYVESVVIDKDITLQGDGPVEDIVITAPEGGPVVPIEAGGFYEDPYAVLLQETEATLSGLTFRGTPSEVIASGGAPTLEDLVFDRTGYAYDGSTTSPAGCSIIVNRGSAAVIRNNRIDGGGPIGVFDGSEPLIEGNTLRGGPHIFGFGFGDGAVIRDNTIEGVLVRGIGVFNASADLLIEGNTIIDPPQHGIEVQRGAATIRRNSVSGAGLVGISASSRGSRVLDNRLTDNQTALLFTQQDALVTDNVVRGGVVGITMGSTGGGQLVGNDIEGASIRGLSILSGDAVLRDNRSCGNGENLFVADAASPDIDGSNEICEDEPAE